MAVMLEKDFSRCRASLEHGVDAEGNPILVTRAFGRILPATTDQDMYDVVQAILTLQGLPVRSLRRYDDGELINVV